jgi:hypothetical protein
MFRSVNFPIDAENFLSARNPHVIRELMPEVRKTRAMLCAAQCRHRGAARATVQIQAKPRSEAP